MRWLPVFTLVLAVRAQAGYNDAPWRATTIRITTVHGEVFVDTSSGVVGPMPMTGRPPGDTIRPTSSC